MPEIITKEVTVYKYEELSQRAKDHALMKHAEWLDDEWAMQIIDEAKWEGAERGFDIDDVRYTICYSQGDGAAWQGRVKLLPFLEHHLKTDDPDHARYLVLQELIREEWIDTPVSEVSYKGFRYNTMSVDVMLDGGIYFEMDTYPELPKEPAVLVEGVLAGAIVAELGKSINIPDLENRLADWLKTAVDDYAHDIFVKLRDEYEYQTSEECFAELCEANDWRFEENGEMV